MYIECSGLVNCTAFRPKRLSYGFIWFSGKKKINIILAICSSFLTQKLQHKGKAIPAQALKVPGG
jgi:hypothetical protein